MKYAQKVILLVAVASFMMGCKLDSVPECLPGQKRCEDNPVLKSGVSYICIENNTWQGVACAGTCADKSECAVKSVVPSCETEGERRCETIDSMLLSLVCLNHQWVPTICGDGATCKDGVCSGADNKCKEDAQLCTDVEALNVSVAALCRDGQWITSYCQGDLGCDGDVCASTESVLGCGEEAVDCTETVTGWAKCSCQAGKCEASSCEFSYHLYDKSCEKNDNTHCGSHESVCDTSAVLNSASVECTNEGLCVSTGCGVGYHLYEQNCEKNDNLHCGSHESVCDTSALANSSTVDCTSDGLCVATGCEAGYHLYDQSCEKNDNTHCGDHGAVCHASDLLNSTSAECTTEGLCIATGCGAGYHINEGVCEKDDPDNCGSHGLKCTVDSVTDAGKVDCVEGKCVATECIANTLCDGSCVDLLKDKDYCGKCDTACDGETLCFEGVCMMPTCGDGENIYLTRTALKPKDEGSADSVEAQTSPSHPKSP